MLKKGKVINDLDEDNVLTMENNIVIEFMESDECKSIIEDRKLFDYFYKEVNSAN